MSLISNLRPLAKGFDLVKGCSLAKGSHGPSSSSCWAWHQPPRAAFWCGHDKSCSPREAPRPGGGPVGVGCPAMVAELVHRPQGPGPASLAKGTTWHSEPGLAMTGSGPGLARPAGSTLAAKHPCKRVKAKEPGRAEVEAAKAKEAEAKAEAGLATGHGSSEAEGCPTGPACCCCCCTGSSQAACSTCR